MDKNTCWLKWKTTTSVILPLNSRLQLAHWVEADFHLYFSKKNAATVKLLCVTGMPQISIQSGVEWMCSTLWYSSLHLQPATTCKVHEYMANVWLPLMPLCPKITPVAEDHKDRGGNITAGYSKLVVQIFIQEDQRAASDYWRDVTVHWTIWIYQRLQFSFFIYPLFIQEIFIEINNMFFKDVPAKNTYFTHLHIYSLSTLNYYFELLSNKKIHKRWIDLLLFLHFAHFGLFTHLYTHTLSKHWTFTDCYRLHRRNVFTLLETLFYI